MCRSDRNGPCRCYCHSTMGGMKNKHVVACCDGSKIRTWPSSEWWGDEGKTTMVDIGGGMIVPLSELIEDD